VALPLDDYEASVAEEEMFKREGYPIGRGWSD
jgi:hypothetical protein